MTEHTTATRSAITGTRRAPTSRRAGVRLMGALLLFALFCFVLFASLASQATPAGASDGDTHAGKEQSRTVYRAWLEERQSSPQQLLTQVTESVEEGGSSVASKEATGVQAGRPLQLLIRVYNRDGSPCTVARVTVIWADETSRTRYERYTDAQGTTTITRWIGPGEKGHRHACVIWAETPEGTGYDYTWFVPE